MTSGLKLRKRKKCTVKCYSLLKPHSRFPQWRMDTSYQKSTLPGCATNDKLKRVAKYRNKKCMQCNEGKNKLRTKVTMLADVLEDLSSPLPTSCRVFSHLFVASGIKILDMQRRSAQRAITHCLFYNTWGSMYVSSKLKQQWDLTNLLPSATGLAMVSGEPRNTSAFSVVMLLPTRV